MFDDPETGLDYMDTYASKEHKDQGGVPIFRHNLMYQIPHRKSSKTHGKKAQVKQFPLKLAWGSTAHKVQGITIKKGTNVVVHGHEKIPSGMYYLMLSRAEEMDQIYIEMPNVKDKKGVVEKLKLKIKANPNSLKENENLVQRSIVPSIKDNHFSIFVMNIDSLQNKILDLTNDVYSQVSDHVCVVETWLEKDKEYGFEIPGKTFENAPNGKGKGCGIFSSTSRKIYKPVQKIIEEKYQIMSIIDETNPCHPYQMVLVYASSGCPFQELAIQLENILHNNCCIITGDFNFDTKESNPLTGMLLEKKFTQLVNWPTHKEGRTIGK